jgi:hypothetical protein
MWLKILQIVVAAARATGLDKKVEAWVGKELDKLYEKTQSKAQATFDKIEALGNKISEAKK